MLEPDPATAWGRYAARLAKETGSPRPFLSAYAMMSAVTVGSFHLFKDHLNLSPLSREQIMRAVAGRELGYGFARQALQHNRKAFASPRQGFVAQVAWLDGRTDLIQINRALQRLKTALPRRQESRPAPETVAAESILFPLLSDIRQHRISK